MFFNSIDFAIFLPLVYIAYWFFTKNNLKLQNLLIVSASYFFYGMWDWRFLFLIILSTLVDYSIGLNLEREKNQTYRRMLLWISISINLGLLLFFKYCNFFLDNFVTVFTFLGFKIKQTELNIILPVGISFYTFQTLSYTIDVYNKKLEPVRDIIAFSAFVSFFPQLVAGPIERATNLLPQFYKKRKFDYFNSVKGIKQIIWGLFKKIVIADSCAQYVNDIFSNYIHYNGLTLLLGALYFTIQIYCDFSGYSDIAIGTSRLFGFSLMKNFKFPYFSRDISEFWRRWHISLSTWFRDYVYIPLGGSRGSLKMKIRNTLLIFLISGFWHGAKWTFIIWGLLNAIYFLPLLIAKRNRVYTSSIVAENSLFPNIKEIFGMISTFMLTLFAWIFFRAESVSHAILYIKTMLLSTYKIEQIRLERFSFEMVPLIILLLIIEWFYRKSEFPFDSKDKSLLQMSFLIAFIIIMGNYSKMESFIYFQF